MIFSDSIEVLRTEEDNRVLGKMQILTNKKHMQGKLVHKIYESARKAAGKYKVPLNIILAIAFVESSYRLNVINSGSNDYGIMQVNQYHVRVSNLDKFRLLNDMDYSFEHGVRIFSWFYKRYPLDEAISRYNCGTAKRCINWKHVKNYVAKVKRSM